MFTNTSMASLHIVALFSLQAPDVSDVKIQRVDRETLHLMKKNDQWVISGPIEDLADLQMAVSFVAGMVMEKGTLTKKEGEIHWQDYQLDNPAYLIEIANPQGQKESIAVSRQRAFDGNYFIKKGPQLIIGSKSWDNYLERDFEYFRDKRLFRNPFEPNRIGVMYNDKGLKQKYSLKKEDKGWVVEGRDMKNFDAQKIEDLIEAVKNLRATNFVSGSNISMLTGSVEFFGADNKNWAIQFGPTEKDALYANVTGIQGLARLTPILVEKIKVSLEDLRNGRLPFQFDVQHVHRIKINTETTKIDLKKTDMNWVLTKTDEKKEVDQAALAQFFQKVQNLNAKKFLKSAPANVKYFRSIQLISADDKEILRIRWGDNPYVSSSKSPETLEVALAELTALPIQTLIKEKSVQEKPKEVQDGAVSDKN